MNPKRLFVGNLTYTVDEKELWELFSRYGEVVNVRIIEGKGYGFVEMESYEDARSARNALNETEYKGRNLLIDDVRPKKSNPGIQKRPGMKYQSGKPSPGRPTGAYGKRGSDEKSMRPPSRTSSTRSSPPKKRDTEYSERTLTSAPRPPGKEKEIPVKKKVYGKPRRDEKPAQKKH